MQEVDIFIVGGGMVGSVLAAKLAPSGMRIALLETYAPAAFDPASPPDLRVSALSPASINLLAETGAWSSILNMRSAPFQRMQVWEQRQDQGTLFDAAEIDAPFLGHIVENRLVQLACLQTLAGYDNVSVLCPEKIVGIHYAASDTAGSTITLENGSQFHTKLLIGADGAQSRVRTAAGIALDSLQYPMQALVATVSIEGGSRDITWQRFTRYGPQSLLPLPGDYASLVWYQQPQEVRRLLALDDDSLLDAFRTQFPKSLPEISGLLQRGSFSLTRNHAQHYVRQGVALIGDAAHTIHPLAGQGVNLGFQDVSVLANLLQTAWQAGENIHDLAVLQAYERQRKWPNHLMQRSMDAFSYGFSNDIAPLKLLRNLGLKLANHPGPLKREVMRYALGQPPKLPQPLQTLRNWLKP